MPPLPGLNCKSSLPTADAVGYNMPPLPGLLQRKGQAASSNLPICREITFIAQFSDLMKLGFQPIHMVFFVLEQNH